MTALPLPVPLVDAGWLASHLDAPSLVLLDATFHPVAPPAPSAFLPHARSFDFDQRICDRSSPLPHMMPSPKLFEAEVRALGVSQSSDIVVYDRIGTFSSPRAWWMFKAMGHERVSVLDGGLPAWQAAGLPTQAAPEPPGQPGDFVARPRPELFRDASQVAAALDDPRYAVLDARSAGRFAGREPEPRPGLRSGHMPHALNLPATDLVQGGRMRSPEELAGLFKLLAGSDRELIFSCGSGVTACVLALGATLAGRSQLSVYDGSWSEWGLPSSRPVEGPSGSTSG